MGFVEKPNEANANELFRAGALWSTFIMVGPARSFLSLAEEHLPEQSALFDTYRATLGTDWEACALESLYEAMDPADFSRDVLEKSEELRVVPLERCGWSDWGTPDRVLASLRGTEDFEVLCARLRTNNSDSLVDSAQPRATAPFEPAPCFLSPTNTQSPSAFGLQK